MFKLKTLLSGSLLGIGLSLGQYIVNDNSLLALAQPESLPNFNLASETTSDKSWCLLGKSQNLCLLVETKDKSNQTTSIEPGFMGHILLTMTLMVIIYITFIGLKIYTKLLCNTWLDKVQEPENILDRITNSFFKEDKKQSNSNMFFIEEVDFPDNIHPTLAMSDMQKERIQGQFQEIQKRIMIHKKVMLYFYSQNFISLSMISGLALVAGICLFFIAEVGFTSANPALVNIFIISSSAGLLYQRLPGIFQQQLNRESNRSLYLKYTDIGNELLSYLATGSMRNTATMTTNLTLSASVKPNDFIHYMDRELAKYHQLPIEFDATKVIKIADFQDTINAAFSKNGEPPRKSTPSHKVATTTANKTAKSQPSS